ncbi:MAG TPA: site-specific integrase [Anaerolineales bacterium]
MIPSTHQKWWDNGLIFPTTIGTPMAARNMYEDFKKLLRRIDLPAIRFHDLRHTAATLMLQQGVHPKIVQERLGHADISMTLNIYSHVLPSMQEDAAEKLDELLNPIDVSDVIKQVSEIKKSYSGELNNKRL